MRSSFRSKRVDDNTLQQLVSGSFDFRADLPVSRLSKFGDAQWNWADPSNRRLECYSPDRLIIDWHKIVSIYHIPERIVGDLKRYAFVRFAHSREVFGAQLRNKNGHPGTIFNEIGAVVRFLSRLCSKTIIGNYNVIQGLSDICVEDMESTLLDSDHHQCVLKKTLTHLALPGMARLLEYGPVAWTSSDIKTLPWRIKKREPYARLPEPLFRLLSDAASSDIRQFLDAMNIQSEDNTGLPQPNKFLSEFSSFRNSFEEYYTMRNLWRNRTKENKNGTLYTVWCRKQGGITRFRHLVDRARLAAELILTMYTGARVSELNSFTTDSLVKDGSEWVLRGTEIKRRSRWAPMFRDKWVAIPIVRDAVKLLRETGRLVNSNDLFHPRTLNPTTRRLGPGEHKKRLMRYLKMVDETNQWSGTELHSLRFRHSLVHELRKAGLGIPYISFQLKHYHDALNLHPSNVTIMYGNLAGTAAQKAVDDANREFIQQIYHPDAAVTGGGAEQHKARRDAYFRGMVVRGFDIDKVIQELAKRGMPLTDVGTALCSGQRFITVDGVKQDPPCIGALRCNPNRCSNAIIPEYKEQAWSRLATENRKRACDPAYAHARSYFEEAAGEAEGVVRFFQIQGRKKHE